MSSEPQLQPSFDVPRVANLYGFAFSFAVLSFAVLRASALKRKNAELERDLNRFKSSPLSTQSSEWIWPNRPRISARSSAASSDAGISAQSRQSQMVPTF